MGNEIAEEDTIDYNYYNNGSAGLRLEVDLAYPKDLYDLHNDYPLALKANILSEIHQKT